jgi:protein O-GlcNAc transferase
MSALLKTAIAAHQQGDVVRAAELYEQVLQSSPNDADALNLLGSLRHTQKRSDEALQLITRSLQVDTNNPPAWFNLGLVYFEHRKFKEAAAAFMEAAKRAPTRPDFWLALGRAYTQAGEHIAARATFENLVQMNPSSPVAWLELAQAIDRAGDMPQARQYAERSAILAVTQSDASVRRHAFNLIISIDRKQNQPKRQWDWAVMHTQIAPDDAEAWVQLAKCTLAHSENGLADTLLKHAQDLEPRRVDIRWLRTFSLALPMYANHVQVQSQVARYTQAVRDLQAFTRNIPGPLLQGVDEMFDQSYPLFLAYTGEDVTEAQRVTGEFFSEIMARTLGMAPIALPDSRPSRGKIHIAFVSETFFYHSNMKLRRSWLKRLDRDKYHITCYHVGRTVDTYTAEIQKMVDAFYHLPDDFHGTLAQLRADAPDIIQYTNVGLKPLTIKLAALRLAPVQCTTWGHPITTGLPTMDYYLSSELMEPEGAQAHYTEKLVNLPGLSVVPQPVFNVANRTFETRTRADYGLQEDDVILLSAQSLQKYLPQFDGVYADIAAQLVASGTTKCKFVFILHAENAAISELFRQRIRAPFYAHGLDPDAYLVFVPFQDQDGYRALNMLADITLDSLGWSGANTTFEALELGGLVITHPGPFMRARHTAGALQLMGLTDLVAPTVDGYVSLAVDLTKNPERRRQLRQKLQAALPKLYADPGVGDALNRFYEDAYNAWRADPSQTGTNDPRAFQQKGGGVYQRTYESYDAYVEHQKTKLNFLNLTNYDTEFSADLTKRLRAHNLVSHGQSALCLGARVGSECKAFIACGAFTIGIDLNPGVDNKYVVVGDFHHLQFADASIDIAYTNCIDHSFDHSLMMAEVKRVLKAGGIFIADIMNGLNDADHWQPDEYDCAFWDSADTIITQLATQLEARVTLKTPMKNIVGWSGQMVVFQVPR